MGLQRSLGLREAERGEGEDGLGGETEAERENVRTGGGREEGDERRGKRTDREL